MYTHTDTLVPYTTLFRSDLADIYQDIRDFIFIFQLGMNETMNDALFTCQENFKLLWGQKLVNTLRALHEVKYSANDNEDEDGEYEDNEFDNDGYPKYFEE